MVMILLVVAVGSVGGSDDRVHSHHSDGEGKCDDYEKDQFVG